MSADDSAVDSLKKLVVIYDRILGDEVRNHALYEKILVVTGLGLIVFGYVLTFDYSEFGLLLILVGVLRTINSIYDFRRGDSLTRKMGLVKKEFGDILAMSEM